MINHMTLFKKGAKVGQTKATSREERYTEYSIVQSLKEVVLNNLTFQNISNHGNTCKESQTIS